MTWLESSGMTPSVSLQAKENVNLGCVTIKKKISVFLDLTLRCPLDKQSERSSDEFQMERLKIRMEMLLNYKPFDKRSTLSKRPSTFDRNESKSNGAAKP